MKEENRSIHRAFLDTSTTMWPKNLFDGTCLTRSRPLSSPFGLGFGPVYPRHTHASVFPASGAALWAATLLQSYAPLPSGLCHTLSRGLQPLRGKGNLFDGTCLPASCAALRAATLLQSYEPLPSGLCHSLSRGLQPLRGTGHLFDGTCLQASGAALWAATLLQSYAPLPSGLFDFGGCLPYL